MTIIKINSLVNIDDNTSGISKNESDSKIIYSLTQSDTIYDFAAVTFPSNSIVEITKSNITVRNAEVSGQVIVGSGCTGCTGCRFENVRIETTLQPVVFKDVTSDTVFEKCLFRKSSDTTDKLFVMNADSSKNKNVTFIDCYFSNYEAVIKAEREVTCTIINGWCQDLKRVVYCDGDWVGTDNVTPELNVNILINGFDFEVVDYVLQAKRNNPMLRKIKIKGDIVINGLLALSESISTSAIVDYEDGFVNLECNAPVTSKFKAFSPDSPETRYCNVKRQGDICYKVSDELKPYEFTFTLKPNAIICPFDTMHVSKVWWTDNDGISVFLDRLTIDDGIYSNFKEELAPSQNDVVDKVGKLVLKNTTASEQTITLTVETNCILY